MTRGNDDLPREDAPALGARVRISASDESEAAAMLEALAAQPAHAAAVIL